MLENRKEESEEKVKEEEVFKNEMSDFFENYYDKLVRYFKQKYKPPTFRGSVFTIEDIVSESFLEILRNRDGFIKADNKEAYMKTIINNKIIDLMNKKGNKDYTLFETPDELERFVYDNNFKFLEAEEREKKWLLEMEVYEIALNLIKDSKDGKGMKTYIEAFVEYYINGKNIYEIMEEKKIKYNTVVRYLCIARRIIREKLNERIQKNQYCWPRRNVKRRAQ